MTRLGRWVDLDPRNREYAYAAPRPAPLRTVLWAHHAPVLDQGNVGACTGFAMAGCLDTDYFAPARGSDNYLDEEHALLLYSKATRLDRITGRYPPDDTGSTGGAAAKAAQKLGYLSEYRWCFSFHSFLAALQVSPVIVGTLWTYEMEDPDRNGFLHIGTELAGGHEYLVLGAHMTDRYVTMLNSWGGEWGHNGRAKISFDDMEWLLAQQGDVTVPIGAHL